MTLRGATTGGSAGATKQPACVMVRAERARGSEDLVCILHMSILSRPRARSFAALPGELLCFYQLIVRLPEPFIRTFHVAAKVVCVVSVHALGEPHTFICGLIGLSNARWVKHGLCKNSACHCGEGDRSNSTNNDFSHSRTR